MVDALHVVGDSAAEMASPPNYPTAARRHKRDADTLHKDPVPRLDNADHLYGFAAECALLGSLRVLHQAGAYTQLTLGKDGSIEDNDLRRSGHIRELWSHMIGRVSRMDRALNTIFAPFSNHRDGLNRNPFHDWGVNDRYGDDGTAKKDRVLAHQSGADACLKVLTQVEQSYLKRKSAL